METYIEKSLETLRNQALAKTNIKKPGSFHWLRHTYATNLLEAGTIQKILGHKKINTTEIYTNMSTKSFQNIKRPFDDL